jgi:hypothetical protein
MEFGLSESVNDQARPRRRPEAEQLVQVSLVAEMTGKYPPTGFCMG